MPSLTHQRWVPLAAFTICLACEESKPAGDQSAPRAESSHATTPTSAAVTGGMLPAPARIEDATFHATFETVDVSWAPQRAGRLRITVVAKPPYHVNSEYPHRFTVDEEQGLRASSRVVSGTALEVTSGRLVVPLSATPEQGGHARIAGELKFSVCTDERCIMEKRRLGLQFPVGQPEPAQVTTAP